ncbi:MAG: DUF5915 domain-containing protein, partial [Candidatus Methanomethyliaceae archaeon]
KDLMAEGLMRDVIRRIQEMRKRAALKVDAYIKVWVGVPSEEVKGLIMDKIKEISTEVRAKEMYVSIGSIERGAYKDEWQIDGEEFFIGIEED